MFNVKLTLSIGLFKMQLQAKHSFFKNEHLLLTYSIATNLMTSPKTPFRMVLLPCCSTLANYGSPLRSPVSFTSAELLPAVLQANS